MKKIAQILIFLISLQTYGQQFHYKDLNEIYYKIDSLKKQNLKLWNSFNLLSKHNLQQDSILKSLNLAVIETKSKVDIYQSALDTDDTMFDGMSTYFTIISILLSIIVIAIPLVNYFLVIKPNAESKKKLESLEQEVIDKIENNFENYFDNLSIKKNKKMISLLDDRSKLSKVTDYFFVNDYEGLGQEDIEKVIKFLENNEDIESSDKLVLNSLVINSKYLISEKYYKSIFEKEDKNNFKYAIEYLVENDFPSHIDYISIIIKSYNDGHSLLLLFFDYIQETYIGTYLNKKLPEKKAKGEEYSILLFDNDKIMNAIKDKEVPKGIFGDEHKININRLNGNPFLRNTKYYDIYLKNIDDKYKKH